MTNDPWLGLPSLLNAQFDDVAISAAESARVVEAGLVTTGRRMPSSMVLTKQLTCKGYNASNENTVLIVIRCRVFIF